MVSRPSVWSLRKTRCRFPSTLTRVPQSHICGNFTASYIIFLRPSEIAIKPLFGRSYAILSPSVNSNG